MLTDPLPEEFREALEATGGRRGRFGERVLFLAETASTNDVAAELAEAGAPEGTTVLALAQTAGRGRLGREWFSPAGAGLYMSIVCRDHRVLPVLTLAGGVAVAEGIRRATGLPVTLKWPNDVVTAGGAADGRPRKIAGILAEGVTTGGKLQFVILGCGVNLRPTVYPPALGARATSIEAELGRPVDAAALLAEILAALNEHVTTIASADRQRMLRRWRELAPASAGARVEWTVNGVTRRGTTDGIDDEGALLVKTADGIERMVAGQLVWL